MPPGQKNWTQETPIPPGSQGSCCWCPELYVTVSSIELKCWRRGFLLGIKVFYIREINDIFTPN